MTKKLTQAMVITDAIEHLLDIGLTDKLKIYDKVEEQLDVPRPTVRRVARDLRTKYQKRIDLLQKIK